MARVVVVGGGFGGLATAIWLADFGHQVIVCERHGSVGGALRGVSHGEMRIDLAPGAITLPAVLRDLFRKTGRPLDRVVDLLPAEPAFDYRLEDGETLELPNTGRGSVVRALDDAFGAGSGAAWQEIVDYGGRVWSAARSPYLTTAPSRAQRLAATFSRDRRRRLGLDRTLRSLAATLPAPLGAILEHRVPGVDPRRAPAGLAAVAYVHQTFGRWYVRGGATGLVAALHDRATERGAAIRTGTPVRTVETSGRRVTGVRLEDGELLGADVVVAAVDTAHLYRDLLPSNRPPRRTGRPSPGRFTVTVELDPSHRGTHPSGSPHDEPPRHTVLFAPETDAALDAVHSASPRPPESPTVDVHSAPDGTRMTARAVVPSQVDVDWTAPGIAEGYADRIVTVLAERGIDIRDRIRWRHVHSPADTAAATGAAGGGEFGPVIAGGRDIADRSNRTPVRGLYQVGRAAYPGPGVPLAGISAAIVADLIGRA